MVQCGSRALRKIKIFREILNHLAYFCKNFDFSLNIFFSFFQCGQRFFDLSLVRPASHFEFKTPVLKDFFAIFSSDVDKSKKSGGFSFRKSSRECIRLTWDISRYKTTNKFDSLEKCEGEDILPYQHTFLPQESIWPTFYKQLLRQFPFAKELQTQTGVNFTNVLRAAFTRVDPNSAKKTV